VATNNGHIDFDNLLDDKVYPALFDRLDTAFPEFRFKKNGDAWVATVWPSIFPYTVDHKRADRLMVYPDNKHRIKVHGHSIIRFLEYVNSGHKPRGEKFTEAVKDLCRRAGVPFPEKELTEEQKERARRLDARRAVLEDVVAICEERLWSEQGLDGLGYLRDKRKLTDEQIRDLRLGLYPPASEVRNQLRQRGHDSQEISAASAGWVKIVGYITLPWRDDRGRMLTIYGRWPGNPPEGKPKTVSMPGERSRPALQDRELCHITARGRRPDRFS
jgi:hypothetical protein